MSTFCLMVNKKLLQLCKIQAIPGKAKSKQTMVHSVSYTGNMLILPIETFIFISNLSDLSRFLGSKILLHYTFYIT